LQGGTTDFPKVLDFGLAKMSEKQMGNGSMMFTQQGMVFGTPEFMSPEQAQGDTLDNRSDIYSLALILYELITGKLPFDAKTPLDIMKAHVRDAPIPLSQRIVGKPFWPDLETVMAKALAKQPSDRYETAAQFGEALLGCLPKSAEAPATVPKRACKRPQEPAAARPNPLSVSRAAKEDDTEITRTQRASDDAPLTARPSRLPKLLLTLMSGLAAVIVAYVLVSWFRR
jgi:serine/threonine-protein kinase